MAKNSNLVNAKRQKNDEFYTMYEDIEKELINYEDQLRDKVVYCNCDDVRESNFLEYLCRQAPHIGIRKVIGSHYNADGSPSYYVTFVPPPNLDHWDGDRWRNYLIEMPMEGNGDFRSVESIRLLQQADIVITNPPFSLFREFVAQLIEYNKKFLIIGSMNAISYKEIFPLIKDNKLWLGYNSVKEFKQPDGSIKKFGNILWYTNLETTKRNQPQELFLSYERRDREYPKYDNYDAIKVSKAIEIPKDYYGVMGVPITWLDKYCPTQFVIINMSTMSGVSANYWTEINGKPKYARIFIRRRQQE